MQWSVRYFSTEIPNSRTLGFVVVELLAAELVAAAAGRGRAVVDGVLDVEFIGGIWALAAKGPVVVGWILSMSTSILSSADDMAV
jgi:hypothetical protein